MSKLYAKVVQQLDEYTSVGEYLAEVLEIMQDDPKITVEQVIKTKVEKLPGCSKQGFIILYKVNDDDDSNIYVNDNKVNQMLNEIYYTHKIKITPELAFDMLCKSLYMDCVIDEDGDYIIDKGSLLKKEKGEEDYALYDDRGALFVALRNVAVNIFANTYFRNAPYIYRLDYDEVDE